MSVSDSQDREIQDEVQRRYQTQTPFKSVDFEHMTDDEHRRVLHHSAVLQRGAPEDAMLAMYKKLGGGELPFVAEHVGDLYWRANEQHGATWGNMNDVDNKVRKTLNSLTHPYGFHRNVEENLAGNGSSWRVAEELGRSYANEHAKLPIYTYPSALMSAATSHLGNLRFGASAGALSELKGLVLHPEDSKYFGAFAPEHPDPERHQAEHEQLWANWKGLHSRQATIDFLKSQGR